MAGEWNSHWECVWEYWRLGSDNYGFFSRMRMLSGSPDCMRSGRTHAPWIADVPSVYTPLPLATIVYLTSPPASEKLAFTRFGSITNRQSGSASVHLCLPYSNFRDRTRERRMVVAFRYVALLISCSSNLPLTLAKITARSSPPFHVSKQVNTQCQLHPVSSNIQSSVVGEAQSGAVERSKT